MAEARSFMVPTVSVLIPCYNAEQWIEQAIASALSQTYLPIEVIVVDDGSTDGSWQVIQQFGDRIHAITQPNQGGNAARNRLLQISGGEWLQYLDADDYLLPTKLEQQIQCLASQPDADVIYSPSILEDWSVTGSRQEILPIPVPHDPWILLARWYLPQTGSPLWRKQAIASVGGWKVDQPCCQEHELYLRLLIAGKQFVYGDQAGSVYRQWSESTVCRQNQTETRRRRLAIIDQAESYLQTTEALTPARQHAINQSRFECARLIWLSDRRWAAGIVAQIRQTEPGFVPVKPAAPLLYRFCYQRFGFTVAEAIAALKRKLPGF